MRRDGNARVKTGIPFLTLPYSGWGQYLLLRDSGITAEAAWLFCPQPLWRLHGTKKGDELFLRSFPSLPYVRRNAELLC